MADTPTGDLERLLEALGDDPEHLSRLRALLGVGDWSRIEASLDRLAQAQARTEQRLEGLTARVDGLAERVDDLAQAQVRTEQRLEGLTQRVDELAQAQTRTEQTLEKLIRRLDVHSDRLAELRGELYERRYRDRGPAYFGPIARSLVPLDWPELNDLLDRAVTEGVLTEEQAQEIRLTDTVLRGRSHEDGRELYLVVEASAGVGMADVQRARHRARLLARLGVETVPVVAGASLTVDAEETAGHAGVWQVTDGRVVAPGNDDAA